LKIPFHSYYRNTDNTTCGYRPANWSRLSIHYTAQSRPQSFILTFWRPTWGDISPNLSKEQRYPFDRDQDCRKKPRVEDGNYRTDLPRPPSVFGRPARTRRNFIRITRPESEESDYSDASTETNGFQVTYEYITRHTPLPPDSDEEGIATDTESAGTDRIADIYHEELDGPIWDWEEFYLEELYELPEPEEQDTFEDMAHPVPTFSGYTASESIITFINELELYSAARTMNAAQTGALLRAALRGPAKTRLEAAIVAAVIAAPTDAATNIAAIAWLRGQYHTVDIQQQLKDQLLTTVQEMNQSPRAYYTKIRDMIEIAGYVAAVQDQVAESTFLQGLMPELALAIRSTPTTLTLEQKVDYAHRYWLVRNPGHQDVYQSMLPKHLRREELPKISSIPAAAPRKDKMDELCEKFAKMEAHIANLDRRPYRPPQAYQAEPDRRRQGPYRQDPNRFMRCFTCGEEGHMSWECRAETNRKAMPSTRGQEEQGRRRYGANMAQPGVTFTEIFSEDEGPDIAYYPAIRKPGRPPKRPYSKEPEQSSSKHKDPVTIYKAPGFDEIDELADEEETRDIRMSESPSREIRHRKSKQYRYNAWEDIKGRQVQMTFEQAAEINPTIKQQIRNGLAETKPSYKVTEINQAQPNDSDSENEEDTRKTSAYAVGTIENIPVEFIIDSGAGGCMIAKETLDHLG